MSEFHLTILGCGSALPAKGRNPSAQILRVGKYRILIDCGEGTQHRIRENHLKMQSISHVFISHMHGDHYLGLMGLLFSMTLLGRKKGIQIAGPPQVQELINMHLGHAKAGLGFPIDYVFTQAKQAELIVDTDSFTAISLPLKHKIATTGFLIQEKPRLRKLIAARLEKYDVPIKHRKELARGADFIQENGNVVANGLLTKDPIPPKSYAYCSDTAFKPELPALISGVDLLYHESTFLESDIERAHRTKHSTAREAGEIANAAKAKRLLLGHYSARYTDLDEILNEAREVFEESYLSTEGMEIDIHSIGE
jgi:ribonuclease Z